MTQTITKKTQNKILQVLSDFQELALLDNSRNLIKSYQKLSLPINEYIICITPRSGSSWLTEILSKTKILGNPEEWFNPGNLPGIIQNRYPCLDVIEYFDCIKRTQCTENKVFGMELSFFQYQLVCEALEKTKNDSSLSLLNLEKNKSIYLYRLDLVAQAVSLYRAVETGMFHSAQKNASEKALIDFDYSEDKIWNWLIHILQQEFGWQQSFSKKGISPLCLTYEEIWSNPNLTKLRIINHVLGKSNQVDEISSYNHTKIANSKSNEIVTKFYENNSEKIEFCLKNRGKVNATQIKKELSL
ncbi:MAG: hypothetical protein F6K24_12815 [Okeania sp. SIO2D1]|nr:hypothetical protein [Okeania sp. SIO2D1]